MFQGVSEVAGTSIAENGHSITSIVDSGFYGKGIYFTSSFNSSKEYSEGAVLVSLTFPGKFFFFRSIQLKKNDIDILIIK